jgi:hypothetical protein
MTDHATNTTAECTVPRSKELLWAASGMGKVIMKDLVLLSDYYLIIRQLKSGKDKKKFLEIINKLLNRQQLNKKYNRRENRGSLRSCSNEQLRGSLVMKQHINDSLVFFVFLCDYLYSVKRRKRINLKE